MTGSQERCLVALPLRIKVHLSLELHIGVFVLFFLGAAQMALPIKRSAIL